MIAQWALMQDSDGLLVNYYGPGAMSGDLPGGNHVHLQQETDYPNSGVIRIGVVPKESETFTIKLRIPSWSKQTRLLVNGAVQDAPAPGAYASITRSWKRGDRIELELDFRLRFWAGEEQYAGKMSVYRGPILYAFDGRYNDHDPDALPAIDWRTAKLEPLEWEGAIPAWSLATLSDGTGTQYVVCDLSSAGQTGNHYRTWLPTVEPSPPSIR